MRGKKVAVVIGLGQFGIALAHTLSREWEVLAIDMDQQRVEAVADSVHRALVLDARDLEALRSVVSADFDEAVVSMGENLEASILSTLHLHQLGVKSIRAKAISEDHAAILELVENAAARKSKHENFVTSFARVYTPVVCGAALALDILAKPLAAANLASALARQGLQGERSRGPTILLVDDEPDILDLHMRLLEELAPKGRILTARNGAEALEVMRGQRPDLVLLDLMMPVLDGFGVLEAMRQNESMHDIPAIVLTAQILTRKDMARLQEGVAAVMSKGVFTGTEMLAQITETLHRSRRLGSEAQRVVRQAMAYIHEHYAEPFSRETLAVAVGLSDRYLTRCFRQETGITPVAYLNRYRIRRAQELLARGTLSVTEVALAAGFSDPSYFARVFRAETGVTPRAYQRGEQGTG